MNLELKNFEIENVFKQINSLGSEKITLGVKIRLNKISKVLAAQLQEIDTVKGEKVKELYPDFLTPELENELRESKDVVYWGLIKELNGLMNDTFKCEIEPISIDKISELEVINDYSYLASLIAE